MLVERRGIFGLTVPTSQLEDSQLKVEGTLSDVEDHHLEVAIVAKTTMGREARLLEN
jgi:hypothetical protein